MKYALLVLCLALAGCNPLSDWDYRLALFHHQCHQLLVFPEYLNAKKKVFDSDDFTAAERIAAEWNRIGGTQWCETTRSQIEHEGRWTILGY